MRSKIFSLMMLSAFITLFAFGILVAQEQPNKDTTNKTDTPTKEKAPDESDLKAKVAELIKQLESTDFEVREKAKEELIKLGEEIIPLVEEALKNATDLEVKSKLTEVLDKFKEKNEAEQLKHRNPPRPLKFKFNLEPGTNVMYSLTDPTGIYQYQRSKDGSVKITAMPNGGKKETKEFKSDAEFKEKWPEVYAKFVHILEKKQDDIPNSPWEDDHRGELDDDNEDDDELTPPGFPGNPDDFQKEIDRLRKELERRFREEFEKEINPNKGKEGHKQYYRSSRKDADGNSYVLTIENGKVTAEFTTTDGEKTVKEYNNYDEFKKNWPEFADLFPYVDREYKPSKLAQKPVDQIEDAVFDKLSEVLRSQLQIDDGQGLLIKELVGELEENKGFFKKAGLNKYDILLEVNGEAITSFKFLKEKFDKLAEGETLTLKIIRKGERKDLTISK